MRVFCLWLNGRKVNNPSDIRNNYDSEALRGYYLGGSLSRWLEASGDSQKARLVEKINPDGDIDRQLAEIFGLIKRDKPVKKAKAPLLPVRANGSFSLGSFSLGSFSLGSFSLGSFSLGSFSLGSFSLGSFSLGSFRLSNNNNNNNGGSFRLFGGSYSAFAGSFSLGSFGAGSFTIGSFGAVPCFSVKKSTVKPEIKAKKLTAEEKIVINLSSEPLNRFGYGIHLI